MLTTVPDMKFSPEQYHWQIVTRGVSLGSTGSVGRGVSRKGIPVKKYTSSTVVKGIYSPRTRKQCSSGLHIWIRNCNKYSYARINGHSKNFSNPQVSKVTRTPGSSMAMKSHNWAQSCSCHHTGIIIVVHLQTTHSPISAHVTINSIKKTRFLPFNLAS